MGLASDIRRLVQHNRIRTGTVTGNFFAGVATSGLPGQDLFTYGVANQYWRLQEAYFNLFPGVFNVAAVISVRIYFTVFGAMQLIDTMTWDADGTDGNVGFIYWFFGAYEMLGPFRCELQSNNAGDIANTVAYDYRVKDW